MADKSKDTGTGGINIDGKVQTMDVGVPDSEATAQKPADYSSGDIAVDKSVKDISKPVRETFAKYLSKSTLGIVGSSPHKNVYPVGSGEGTQVDQLNLKDANGNPTSPGSQNNENKFATDFNSTIASNNPAGIKRGLATGTGPDGNTLLPNARKADGTLVEPLNTYTANVVDRNLYDYDSSRIEITDGTLNLPSSPIREIRKMPYGFPADGGSSQGILSEEPNYALPDVDRFGQPGVRTTQNFFPIEFETELVKPWDVNNKPISVTAAQNNTTNAIFFTKIIKIVGEGDNQKQVVDTSLVSTYTPALITSTLKIKRGQTANESGAIDGNKLLTQIAPRANAPEPNQVNFTSLSSTAGDYTSKVVDPNLYDYNSTTIGLVDGTVGSAPTNLRDIRIVSTGGSVATDGGTSKNILGPDNAAGDYTLTSAEARSLAGSETSSNSFPIQSTTDLVTLRDSNNLPISVTAAQTSFTNVNFFTKVLKIQGQGANQQQVVSALQLPTYTPAFISAIGATANPFKIKRGRTAGVDGAPDGHTLLANIAPKNSSGDATLTPSAKTYTNAAVEPNLFDYNSALVGVSDGTLGGQPTGIRDVRIIPASSGVATDGGTSKNILGSDNVAGDYTLTAVEARALAGAATTGNKFPIDAVPVVTTLRDAAGNPVSVTAAQATTTNTKFFTAGKTSPTSYTAVLAAAGSVEDPKKFVLKRGKTAGLGPDGNDLLLNIAPESDGKAVLTDAAATYTQKVIEPNLNDYDTALVGLTDGTLVAAPSNVREDLKYIPADSSIKVDGGSSTNILGADATAAPDYTLTLADRATQASIVTAGNFFKLDAPTITAGIPSTTKIISSTPLSATDAQNNPFNSSFFTKEVQKIDNVDKVFSKLRSSYTDALTTSATGNNPFIIKRGKTEKTGGTDGNSLLSTIAPETDGTAQLTDKAKTYVDAVLSKNLYKPTDADDKAIVARVGRAGPDFFGPKQLHKPVSGPADAGTFDNIQSDPSKRAVTREVLFQRAADEVAGVNAPGGVGNTHKPAPVLPQTLFQFTTPQGYPVSPSSAQSVVTSLDQYTTDLASSYSDAAGSLSNGFKRGKQTGAGDDGNTIFNPTVTGKSKPAPLVDAYVSAVIKKNRFTGESRYANQYLEAHTPPDLKNIAAANNFDANFSFVAPNELRMGSSNGNNDAAPRRYSFSRLAQIGTILSLRAAREIGSGDDGYDPTNTSNQDKTLLPGTGQLGAGSVLSTELLNVKNIINTLTESTIEETQLVDFNSTFEGTINHALEKFSGFTSLGMIALASALGVAITAGFVGLSLIPTFTTLAGGAGLDSPSPGMIAGSERYGLGTYVPGGFSTTAGSTNIVNDFFSLFTATGPAAALFRIFNLQPTRIPFVEAVFLGLGAFFGIGTDNTVANITTLAAPGQVVIVCRSIVRSVSRVVAAFKDLVDKFRNPTSFVAGAESLVETLYAIRDSRALAVMNVLAQIGDSKSLVVADTAGVLGVTSADYDVTDSSKDAGMKISKIDAAPDLDPQARHGKSRLFGGSQMRLAWSTNQAPTQLWIPGSVMNMNTAGRFVDRVGVFPNEVTDANMKSGRTRLYPASGPAEASRMAPETVDVIENMLDSEYVPFYFHDLRTNEVLGFHAFLTNISDDYVSSYDSVDAFGRVEPVKVYKNTVRKISIGFMIAALDQEDFDVMWTKVNKLVTLVYPQFTLGRMLQLDEANKFVRPFTQSIAASPMVRLRVGDLFASNYSKFNLAGIFGLRSPEAAINGRNMYGNKPALDKQTAVAARKGNQIKELRAEVKDLEAYIAKFNQADDAAFEEGGGYEFRVADGEYTAPANVTLAVDGEADAYENGKVLTKINNPSSAFGQAARIVKLLGPNDPGYPQQPKPPQPAKKPPDPQPSPPPLEPHYYVRFKTAKELLKPAPAVLPPAQAAPTTAPKAANTSTTFDVSKLYVVPKSKLTILKSYEQRLKDARAAAENKKTATKSLIDTLEAGTADLTQQENKALKEKGTTDAVAAYADNVNEFLNESNNVITRSFRSSGGKGLAGFIETMNFDWYNGVTWSTENTVGKKAPKMCKVTISFAPIHDIAPGLDSEGYNRAPVYPVGPYARVR